MTKQGFAAAAVIAAGLALTPASIADASTADALAHCQAGWPPNSSIGTYTLAGDSAARVEAGLSTITSGNVVRIIGSGRVHYGGFLGWAGEWGPEGNGRPAATDWAFPGASEYSAAGSWYPTGATVPFNTCTVLGAGSPSMPQKLFLGVNDHTDDFGDNKGSYQVAVWVYHR